MSIYKRNTRCSSVWFFNGGNKYVKKEFVGGCDIVKEMYESGELSKLLESKGISFKAKN